MGDPRLSDDSGQLRLSLADIIRTLASHSLIVDTRLPSPPSSDPITIQTDSRRVKPGDGFIAYRGAGRDGHDFLGPLAASGTLALAIIDRQSESLGLGTTPWIAVSNSRAAWSYLASACNSRPERELSLIGVTGTNGKTSVVWMTGELLKTKGVPSVGIGTLGARFPESLQPTGHTTPDPGMLFSLMKKAVSRGIRHVAMEVSSHALDQQKVAPLSFKAAGFTSFSRDHLDYHQTMESYWGTKWRLLTEHVPPGGHSALCDRLPLDSSVQKLPSSVTIYGFNARETARRLGVRSSLQIMEAKVEFPNTRLRIDYNGRMLEGIVPYFGDHAIENFCCALILADVTTGGLPPLEHWRDLASVPGRLEHLRAPGRGPTVVVDYAHTPDALEKTLAVLRPYCAGRLLTVFGCGGDRDKGKRPLMGAIAASSSDLTFVTSDNPRTEDPAKIISDILVGIADRSRTREIADRESAIAAALQAAKDGDIVLIAGKGHESVQIIGTESLVFDDREVARRLLSERND